MSPELEKKEYRTKLRNCVPFVTPEAGCEETQELIDWFEAKIADLEAKALSARAEALEEAARVWIEYETSCQQASDFCAGIRDAKLRALAQTQPPDVSKEI